MNTYTSDLDLRLAVAQTMPDQYPNARMKNGWPMYYDEDNDLDLSVPRFDNSFNEIIPLVRKGNVYIIDVLMAAWKENHCHQYTDFALWLIEAATPADYCRAYLAAKG